VLEQLFFPRKVRRIRRCWLAADIERYLAWLRQRGFSEQMIRNRVPPLVSFGRFTQEWGVRSRDELPDHVDAFVAQDEPTVRRPDARSAQGETLEGPQGRGADAAADRAGVPRRPMAERPWPFAETAPGFLGYLRDERGLRATTIRVYAHHLRLLQAFMAGEGLCLRDLRPASLTAFVVARSRAVGSADVAGCTGVLRVFLTYARRERLIERDLASAVEHPKSYALATLPRSIFQDDVSRFLAIIDRKNNVGRRDYAMLLLLVTYGLRAREVAALTLDDLDWRRERLRVPMRKGGHHHLYPLTAAAGQRNRRRRALEAGPSSARGSHDRLPMGLEHMRPDFASLSPMTSATERCTSSPAFDPCS
jgi:integrase/recombinase XerD